MFIYAASPSSSTFPNQVHEAPVTSPSLHYIGTTQSPSTHLARWICIFSLSCQSFHGSRDQRTLKSFDPGSFWAPPIPFQVGVFTFGTILSFIVFFLFQPRTNGRRFIIEWDAHPPQILPHHPSRPSMGSNGLGMRKPIKKKLSQRTNDGELNNNQKHILPVLPTYCTYPPLPHPSSFGPMFHSVTMITANPRTTLTVPPTIP